jgi:hypothetical protein
MTSAALPAGWPASRLGAFEVPVRVLLWRDTLPRNPAGKILENELQARSTPSRICKKASAARCGRSVTVSRFLCVPDATNAFFSLETR